MQSQLGYTFTVWRWSIAIAGLFVGTSMLRDADGDPRLALLFLLVGAGLMGLEFYLRRTRKTLVLNDGNVEVFQRGTRLGSIPARFVRHWDRSSRTRALVKAQVVSFVCFFVFGSLIFYSGDTRLGLVLLSTGVIFSAAAIWEFRTLWQIVLPAPARGDSSMDGEMPREANGIVIPLPSRQMVILLRKPDVVTLLGYWPMDRPRSGGR